MKEITPYNTGEVGKIPEDISVQLQADLSKIESYIVYFLEDVHVNTKALTSWVLVEHLHSLDAISKLKLFDSTVKANWENHPKKKDEFSLQCRKRVKRNIQRMLELRNILSHCQHASIKDGFVIARHSPKAGQTETKIALSELENFVGNGFLNIFGDLKFLFNTIDN